MFFNSMTFAVFFTVVVCLNFALSYRLRPLFLLGASYFFYMSWNPKYALLILTSTLVDYVAGIAMAASDSRRRRTQLLLLSLAVNLGILFTFKYANFALVGLEALSSWLSVPIDLPALDVLLPVGISFYTFQTLSYTIDVYRGRIGAERNFLRFALFVSFFPQLVAGPIERAASLLPQIRRRHDFDLPRVWSGLQLMAWGLFKKVVIADRLAIYVDAIWASPELYEGPSLLLASYFFAFQIYCDFSGYSDIAIGGARILGFDLMQNFRQPFLSKTMPEFWQRWHISLMTWFRDYVFMPMALLRTGWIWIYFTIFTVMLVSGIWHGAAWTFVVWGAVHGLLMCLSRLTLSLRDRFYAAVGAPAPLVVVIRTVITFHLFVLSLVLFRSTSLSEGVYILTHLLSGWPELHMDRAPMVQGVIGIALLMLVQIGQSRGPLLPKLRGRPLAVRWAVYYAVFFAIAFFGVDRGRSFIYFQF